MYELRPTQENKALFFSMNGETAERHGVIGHLRADFDSGKMFYSTWYDNQAHLKTQAFKHEFDEVINSLRNDGKKPPFASRANLSTFCYATPGENLDTQGHGYMIRTQDFSYYLRCDPRPGAYDIYCYAYDNDFLLPELAGKHELPDFCYSVLPHSLLPRPDEIIKIERGVSGYSKAKYDDGPELLRKTVDNWNLTIGVTRAQEEAMLAGSMLGWDTPAAKPWNYDKSGRPMPPQPKKNEPER